MKRRTVEIAMLALLAVALVVSVYNAMHGYKLNLEQQRINERWEFIVEQYEQQLEILKERMKEDEQQGKMYFAASQTVAGRGC